MNPSEQGTTEARVQPEMESQSEGSTDSEHHALEETSDRKDWQLWPPSPKVQIVLIAMGFGFFNLILLAIWAIVMVYRF